MIDIKQLKYFATIVEEGQITKAAKKLHMAQPPLSQQLKQLEETLGITLLERNGRKLELTAPGKILYKKAKQLLHQLEDAILEVREMEDGTSGVLSIGCVKSCFYYLSEIIRPFHQLFPNIKFHLREGDSFSICELLRQREIDIGIVRLPIDSHHYEMIHLPNDPYIAVFPRQWNISKPYVYMKEFADIPLLLLHRIQGKGQYELVINECRRHGFEPKIICECPDATILLSLVSKGIGATIVPKSTVSFFCLPDICVLDIADSSIYAEAAAIIEKNRYIPKSTHHFLTILKEKFSNKIKN
ncbi:LysR family transcriptional regulator [Parageobacillus thermoglucosidasius]|uniref:LysR family transcriptional regulator n=2 Tax=Parageobacillus thermoglucosidasius TaxID=1426 RepID=A0AB38QXW2_PARTM|nr:LysR family transcriptional regulator [Parageobacillus thermoglucosidasius]ALF08656.1 LysR family transcriptional regulator [Parageobacillus thermoglucosidasius]ANZ28740.1 LysR family transcriptional regulator [Parageobacillus thermoglucosidasius]APM79477.1 LysR family transcriptional regulator [Parageobacillus thermoglucosidasius]KJX68659.1 LysR family transcriptional regulator [Parageobacillus thermoglucosidasius]RDE26603.1 LysR family transcriptional regulator [Parageobacillus thermogluc